MYQDFYNNNINLISIFMKVRKCIKQVLLNIVFLGLSVLTVFSQEREITGKITDAETGEPLIGVTIQVEGSTKGTITDFDGNYSIKVSGPEDVLQYSYIGYEKKAIKVGDKSSINVELKEEVSELEEVVVVGYGTVKKEDLTGAVSKVESKKLEKVQSSNLEEALQGQATGLIVSRNSGKPGGDASVRIRGLTSFRNSNPLYVIDGIPVQGSISNKISPSDIESVEVLKDASAAAIYGSRAGNGVIIISTKRGSQGREPEVNVDYYQGVSSIPKSFDLLNADQYMYFMDSLYGAEGKDLPSAYMDTARQSKGLGDVDTDWQDAIRRQGSVQNISVNVAGGSEKSNYSIGGTYYNENGPLITTNFERFNIRANSDFQVTDKFKIGESINITKISENNATGTTWSGAVYASPLMPIYDTANLGGYAGPNSQVTGASDQTNPVAELKLNQNTDEETRVFGNIYAQYEFIKGLNYKIRLGEDFRYNHGRYWSPEYVLGYNGEGSSRDNEIATLNESASEKHLTTIQNLLTYNKDFGKHHIDVLAGHEFQKLTGPNFSATGSEFRDMDINVLRQAENAQEVSGEISNNAILSYFGRLNYNFKGKYFLTANFRRDATSKTAKENRVGYFPSFSGAWKFSEEPFWTGLSSIINSGKLRASWGKVGNVGVLDDFEYIAWLDPAKNTRYVFGDQVYFGAMMLESYVNYDVTWETTISEGVGVDLGFLQNKILFTADYYYRKTDGMLVSIPITMMAGKLYGNDKTRPNVNIGEILNQGGEFSLEYRKYEGAFNYSVSANLTTVYNEVLKVSEDEDEIKYQSGGVTRTVTRVGHTIGNYYGYVAEGLFEDWDDVNSHAAQESGTEPGDIKFKDLNKDGKISDEDRTMIGKYLPDLIYGFTFNCSYKGFDFNMLLQGQSGFDIYNGLRSNLMQPGDPLDKNKMVDVLDYWRPNNTDTEVPRITASNPNRNDRLSSYWLEDGSFLRLQSVQLGYTIPQKVTNRVNINSLRVYVTGNNLYVLTGYTGYDPEVGSNNPLSGNYDYGNYPIPRSFRLGLQLGF